MQTLFPLAPVFLDLAGRPVLFLAADAACARAARAMLDAGAGVTLFDPAPCAEAETLAPPARLVRRRWRLSDVRAAALVVAGAGEKRPMRARLAAKGARAIFLMLETPALSDIVLGEIAARGPLALGVSSGGLPPALAHAVRERIEEAAPAPLAGFFEAAARLGPTLEAGLADPAGFWRAALLAAITERPGDWAAWLRARA